MWKLFLDTMQRSLITQLEASREIWQQSGTYNAKQYLEPPAVRRSKGVSLRKDLDLPHATYAWAFLCGGRLARSHAGSRDGACIGGDCGDNSTLRRALTDFAESYGDQPERDHAKLVQAIKRGRVKAAGE